MTPLNWGERRRYTITETFLFAGITGKNREIGCSIVELDVQEGKKCREREKKRKLMG